MLIKKNKIVWIGKQITDFLVLCAFDSGRWLDLIVPTNEISKLAKLKTGPSAMEK